MAKPTVHTTALAMPNDQKGTSVNEYLEEYDIFQVSPCKTLATTSTGTVVPKKSNKVAHSILDSPIRKGPCRVETLSAINPATGENTTEDPANTASKAEVYL